MAPSHHRDVSFWWPLKHAEKKNGLHPRKLTWKLKMMVFYRNLLFQGLIFRFHVSFRGCRSQKKQRFQVPFSWWLVVVGQCLLFVVVVTGCKWKYCVLSGDPLLNIYKLCAHCCRVWATPDVLLICLKEWRIWQLKNLSDSFSLNQKKLWWKWPLPHHHPAVCRFLFRVSRVQTASTPETSSFILSANPWGAGVKVASKNQRPAVILDRFFLTSARVCQSCGDVSLDLQNWGNKMENGWSS